MPMPAATTRRRRRFVIAAAVLATLMVVLYLRGGGSLEEFVGRDLRKLDDGPDSDVGKFVARFLPRRIFSERSRLNTVLARSLPKELLRENDIAFGFQPWYIWQCKTDRGQRFVVLMGLNIFVIPGTSAARFAVLDESGSHIGHTDGSTGWRIDIGDAALLDESVVGGPVIEIYSFPVINGEDIAKQHYAVVDDRVALVRLENSKGLLIRNNYVSPNHQIGPPPTERNAEGWEALLHSPEPARILEALTWIGGRHSSVHNPTQNVLQEDANSVQLIAEVRRRPGVVRRIAELTDSDHPWIREAAALAKDEIAPLE